MLPAYELEQRTGERLEASEERRSSTHRTPAKNRGKLDTLAEIVNACTGGANKSRVMLVANVNSVVATEMLSKLVSSGLIRIAKDGNSVAYEATREGLGFVNKYSELVSMLCPGMVPQTRLNELARVAEPWI